MMRTTAKDLLTVAWERASRGRAGGMFRRGRIGELGLRSYINEDGTYASVVAELHQLDELVADGFNAGSAGTYRPFVSVTAERAEEDADGNVTRTVVDLFLSVEQAAQLQEQLGRAVAEAGEVAA